MSSNPANTLPPQYDEALPSDYDPEFTADISTKMRVPERIGASEHGEEAEHPPWVQHSSHMKVPEKIVLAGQDASIGMKDDPKLHFEPLEVSTHVGLQTPPRVITLENRPLLAMEEEKSDKEEEYLVWPQGIKSIQDASLQNGFVSPSPAKHSSDSLTLEASMSIPGDGLLIRDDHNESDVVALRRQMAKLSRHVMRLEEENSKRSQRELVLYPLVIGYVLFQVARWFVQGR